MKTKLLSKLQPALSNEAYKIRGLSELIMCYDGELPPLDQGDVWYGIGLILHDSAKRLRHHERSIDEYEVAVDQCALKREKTLRKTKRRSINQNRLRSKRKRSE